MKKAAVLALQGAFFEHERMLSSLGASTVQFRQRRDLLKSYDVLILPGGESTVQGKLLRELDMFSHLQEQIREGLPTLATCAGLILLAEKLSNDERAYFQTLPVTVRRNAYGRQLGSFRTWADFSGIGRVPMTFIRAPYVEKASPSVQTLARVDEHIVAVRYKNQLALSFHPELDPDTRIYEAFLSMAKEAS
ncbi:MAG: pyridoxal 5'-phosphate synthase glutaminase subunit PdxT [Eubacteriales bacterium]|nr:pyridoxal 5'-phosphate synthase glutaminase subunit PdxT [Eubacteriales bacterium]